MNEVISELLDVLLRGTISLVTLFLITKMLGKKQVAQLSMFDYVIGISIGNFAAEATMSYDTHYLSGVLAVLLFGGVSWLISYATLKSIKLRQYFRGAPVLVIDDGKIVSENLNKLRFDINDLLEECRSNGYFDISQIAYGVMECTGKVSFLPKTENTPTTIQDLKIKRGKVGLLSNVIIDGKIMKDNLHNIKKDEEWLLRELKSRNKELGNVVLATVDNQMNLKIFERYNNISTHNILE